MSKFVIDINSPDGEFQKFEIENALSWLMNHDGIVIRGLFKVTEVDASTEKEI